MAYIQPIDKRKIIEQVLPEYTKISKAPTRPPEGVNYETWAAEERKVRYKAVDENGNVYLIQNPAVWDEYSDDKGRRFKVRPQPILRYTYAKAQSEVKSEIYGGRYGSNQW